MSLVPGEYYLVKKCIMVVVSVHLAALRFRLSFYIFLLFLFPLFFSFPFLYLFMYLFIHHFLFIFYFFFFLFHVDYTNCPISLHPA